MLDKPSDEQLCYPGSNVSCIRAQVSVGDKVGLYMMFGGNILVNIVGNSVVILSIGHFKQLHSPTNMLVLSLAVVDLLLGVTVVPLSMTRTVEGCWFYGDTFCQLHTGFGMFLCSVSIFHLVCIAVDRYEAVCNPLRYSNNITMSVGTFMVLACWVLPTLNYGLLYSKNNVLGLKQMESVNCLGSCNVIYNSLFVTIYSLLFFFLPCSVIVGLYTKIFLVAEEQVRKIEGINQLENAKGVPSRPSEHKAAKTLGIVVGVYITCWMPCFLFSFIYTYTDLQTPATLLYIFSWLAYFNSTMNPIIYALFYPWFRKCFKLVFKLKIFSKNSSDINIFC